MTMMGMVFTELSASTLATVRDGIEYRIRERNDGTCAVIAGGCVVYRADDMGDAVDWIHDCEGGD